MKSFTRTIAPLIGLLLVTLPTGAAPAPRPHIILMVADDLGWGDVGFHGSKIKTPHLDQLAKEGVQLTHFYVQPVCSPTRGALLTGRYPIRLGLQCGVVRPWAKHGLPLDEETLPDALRGAGYTTAIVGKWHLGHHKPEHLPTRRGFDQQYGHYNGALDYFTHIRDGGHDWHRNDKQDNDKGYATDLIGNEAARIIREHDTSNPASPLFLYVPFNAPHTPLQAPEDQIARNTGYKIKNRQIFAAMVTSMDDAIGQILAASSKHLPREKTLIFFCSDNGGIKKLGSNGKLRGEKSQLYEGGIRVPSIVSWQGTLSPGKITESLHITDLFPTLLGLSGAERKGTKALDGKNVWPTIAEGKPSPHETILHNVTPFSGALREGDWKIIHNGKVRANATSYNGPGTWELFNLRSDPFEQTNLAEEKPKILARLRKKLNRFATEAVKPNIPPNNPPKGFKIPKVWGEED